MNKSIDGLKIFQRPQHNPSYFEVNQSFSQLERPVLDFCVPANPYFPTTDLWTHLGEVLPDALRYYPRERGDLDEAIERYSGVPSSNILLGNGSTELITILVFKFGSKGLLTEVPTFGKWTDLPKKWDFPLLTLELAEEANFQLDVNKFASLARDAKPSLVVVCNPNNPTGQVISKRDILSIYSELRPNQLLVIDESFMDFCENSHELSLTKEATQLPNMVVLKSLGKSLGLHGLRLGILVGSEETLKIIEPHVPSWNLNGIATEVLKWMSSQLKVLEDSWGRVVADRIGGEKLLERVPSFKVFPSQTCFTMVKVAGGTGSASRLRDQLITGPGIFVRDCKNKVGGSDEFLRIATRPMAEIQLLIEGVNLETRLS